MTDTILISTPTDFLRYFLNKRNLDAPDGRAIYAYKITKAQYNSLKKLLTEKWSYSSSSYACFILYAVEYLKSEFQVGALNWE